MGIPIKGRAEGKTPATRLGLRLGMSAKSVATMVGRVMKEISGIGGDTARVDYPCQGLMCPDAREVLLITSLGRAGGRSWNINCQEACLAIFSCFDRPEIGVNL
jgi:hypothetical protein